MPYIYLDRRKKPPVYRFQYWDYLGNRRSGTGTGSKAETEKLALQVQARENAIKKGWVPEPKESQKAWSYSEIMAEYLEWGNAQGGRGGRPWSKVHAHSRMNYLRFWKNHLKPKSLSDLRGCLPRVERSVRKLLAKGKSGKTAYSYAMGLKAFCYWCEMRGYMDENPLKRFQPMDTTPKTQRRALTIDEIRLLLTHSAPHRRLLYEVAFCTGLRAKELKSLVRSDLDVNAGGLVLHASWTKNRKPGFQPLPRDLVVKMKQWAEDEMARKCYKMYTRKSDAKPPADPLLYVPSHPARELEEDLDAAGIPKWTDDGKVDFHACRVAYITLLFEGGADVKTVQTLARHCDPRITMNVYARSRRETLAKATEALGESLLTKPMKNMPAHVAAPTSDTPNIAAG